MTRLGQTEVCITIDTEFSIGGAFDNPETLEPLGRVTTWCEVDGRSEGLGFILRELEAKQLAATFFVETQNVHYFGDEEMGHIAQHISGAGHDLQLHLHPCWGIFQHDGWRKMIGSEPPNDQMNKRTVEDAAAVLQEGIDTFARWSLPRPMAARMGSLKADLNVYKAMAKVELPLASNVGLAVYTPQEPELHLESGRHLIEGILEVPVLTYADCELPGYRHLKNWTITGSSFAETRMLLEAAQRLGVETVVLLTHPSEFVKHDMRFDDIKPNGVNQRRFSQLCRFLADNRDRFSATTFGANNSWLTQGESKGPPLRVGLGKAIRRVIGNKVNDHVDLPTISATRARLEPTRSSSKSETPLKWKRLSTPEAERGPLRARIETLLEASADAGLMHSHLWMFDRVAPGARKPMLFGLDDGDKLLGYAPFVVQPWDFKLMIGEYPLTRRKISRLSLMGGPVLLDSSDPVQRAALTREMLAVVERELPAEHVVYVEGVSMDREADFQDVPFYVIRYGIPSAFHSIEMPGTFNDYMGRLSKRTREGLRRGRRKLAKKSKIELDVINKRADIARFVREATEISKKTYQWHLLGLGLRDPERLRKNLELLADHGAAYCFLLRVDDQPTAFMIGNRYRDAFHYVDVGFDPDFKKQSVGTILHMDAIQYLIENEPGLKVFDFSTGSGAHKERFGTTSATTVNLLLVPKTLKGASLAAAYLATDNVSRKAAEVLDRYGYKDKLKKWLRQRSTESS